MAGSRNMAGAAYLSGKAAAITGTGLVRVVSGRLQPGDSADTFSGGGADHGGAMLSEETLVKCRSTWADAVGIGPGLSTGRSCEKELACCAEQSQNSAGAGCGCLEYFVKASGLVEKEPMLQKS